MTLTATAGSITTSGSPTAVALDGGGGTITLVAATGIGTSLNPLTVDPLAIKGIRVAETIKEGVTIYRAA